MTKGTSDRAEDRQDRGSRFLLVVDSDANNLFYTSMLLQRFEYNICTAKTAEEALEMAAVAVPALVITDLAPLGMSGLELIRVLRLEPQTAAVPVIVKAGTWTPEIDLQCWKAGAAACIHKPVRAEELFRAVQAAIESTPRSNIRIPAKLPVVFPDGAGNSHNGVCTAELSEQGLYVSTLTPLPVKARLPIQLDVKGRRILADAEVIYTYQFGENPSGDPGMGLAFVRLEPRDREHIRAFIKEEITRGIKSI